MLPRRVVEQLGSIAANRQRSENEKKLPDAATSFEDAYRSYWKTGRVPADAERLLFLATWGSGGTLPQTLARSCGSAFTPEAYRTFDDDLLRDLDPVAVSAGVERDGYFVAPTRLSEEAVDDIEHHLERGPAAPRGDGLGTLPAGRPGPSAPTWWMHPSETLKSTSVRRLLRERRLAEVGGNYLGVDPMIMSVVLWKSFAWPSPDKNSAQAFHYDNDRPSFVKMFVYLTDVGPANGPHTYVRGSHRQKPSDLLHGQRLSDAEVERFYPRDGWVTITGRRGTVFFADTQGFHKGGQVLEGHRAMFQINLASDRFGAQEASIGSTEDAPADLAPAVAAAPRYFSELYTPATPTA